MPVPHRAVQNGPWTIGSGRRSIGEHGQYEVLRPDGAHHGRDERLRPRHRGASRRGRCTGAGHRPDSHLARGDAGRRSANVGSDAASLSDAVAPADRARAELGELDLLFVNAGITRSASLAETDEAVYDEVFATNTKGAYFTVQALAPLIVDGGAVVMSTSVANVKGLPLTSVYAASKAALRSMARTFARELLPRGSASTRSAPAPSTPASSNGRFLRTSSSGVARRWWPTTRWLDSDAMRRSRECRVLGLRRHLHDRRRAAGGRRRLAAALTHR